jgi:SAM-dependent methyltransferase
MNQVTAAHNKIIIAQFTQQAIPFTNKPEHSQESSLKMLLNISEVSTSDTVLDVACGSGIVACAFAKVAQHVTGIDITPAMIERAKLLQQEKQLHNITWQIGDILSLPYSDASFSLIVSRYAFHHFTAPTAVMSEMVRVCSPGGKVMVVDVAPSPEKVDAYNHVEKLRDPSHTRALTLAEIQALAVSAGLCNIKTNFYQLEMELEQQLEASFPNPGDADRIRQLFREDLGRDRLGVGTHLRGEEIYFAYPIAIVIGQKRV